MAGVFKFHLFLPHGGGYELAVLSALVAGGVGGVEAGGNGTGEAAADHVGGVHDKDKGVGVDVPHDPFQFGNLGEVDDGEDDFFIAAGECALSVEEGRAVVDVPEDGVGEFVGLFGYDEGRFSLGEADDDAAGYVGVDVHGDEGRDGGLDGEEAAGDGDDEAVQRKDNVADFQIVVFFYDGAHDVKAACVGVIPVEDARADAEKYAAGDGGDHRFLDGVPLGDEMGHVDADGDGGGADDGDDGVEFPQMPEREEEDRNVEEGVGDADGKAGDVVDDHGDPGEAARDEVVGDEKQVEAQRVDGASDECDYGCKKVGVQAEVVPFHFPVPFLVRRGYDSIAPEIGAVCPPLACAFGCLSNAECAAGQAFCLYQFHYNMGGSDACMPL